MEPCTVFESIPTSKPENWKRKKLSKIYKDPTLREVDLESQRKLWREECILIFFNLFMEICALLRVEILLHF